MCSHIDTIDIHGKEVESFVYTSPQWGDGLKKGQNASTWFVNGP